MATQSTRHCEVPAMSTQTMQLRLASGNGPISRTVLRTPLRDALPSEIPLIDISPTFSNSLEERQVVARKIHDAATNIGFFYIGNHGIPPEIIDDAYEACLGFFRQDRATKMKASTTKGPIQAGYRAPETQMVNPNEGVDICESYNIRYNPEMDPTVADPASIPEHAAKYLPGRNTCWNTDSVPHFQGAITRYYQACLGLARALTRAFALSLNLAEDAFDSKVQYPEAMLYLLFYPPLPRDDKVLMPGDANLRVSVGSHTDFQLFTMLWQDNNGGLQVLNKEGQWIAAKPLDGTFVVNIGDYFQRMTNDKYMSTVHRAQNWSGRERVSMPFFWGFGLHESCGVLDNCLEAGEEKKYDEVRCVDWFYQRMQESYQSAAD